MRILLTISIFALVSLLWAAVSIIQHIRRSRRRRRILRARQIQPVAGILGLSGISLPVVRLSTPDRDFAEYSFAALAPRNIAPASPGPSPQPISAKLPAQRHQPLEPFLPQSSILNPSTLDRYIPIAEQTQASQTPVQRLVAILDAAHDSIPAQTINRAQPIELTQAAAPEPPPQIEAPPHLQVLAEVVPTEFVPSITLEAPPAELATPLESLPPELETPLLETPLLASDRRPPSRALPAQPAANEPDTQLRRPVRSVHPAHPAVPFIPTRRPDWVYFNKDMGDLSDPVPSRIRDRARAR